MCGVPAGDAQARVKRTGQRHGVLNNVDVVQRLFECLDIDTRLELYVDKRMQAKAHCFHRDLSPEAGNDAAPLQTGDAFSGGIRAEVDLFTELPKALSSVRQQYAEDSAVDVIYVSITQCLVSSFCIYEE